MMSQSPRPESRACLKSSLVSFATDNFWPMVSPSSRASLRSFCMCLRGKVTSSGLKASFSTALPLMLYQGLEIAPAPRTSNTSSFLSPDFSENPNASHRAVVMLPRTMLATSFILAPMPTSPRNTDFLPMTSKWGTTSLKRLWSPAARMTNCPSSAGFLLPETGASRNRPPFSTTALLILLLVSGSTVLMSTMHFPGRTALNIPSLPKVTSLHA
mmetsp:Transcript_2110/g.4864  ORF Transcript_2110/g.4864 Transcript_2110/m.4864 type:complete len:214 (-) Transcript_2110:206-847(-)